MNYFFVVAVPIIFYIVTFFVKLIIEGSYKENQLYLGVELALGNLSSTITYMYGLIKNKIAEYENQTSVSGQEISDTLRSLSFPLVFIVVIFIVLIGIICLHKLFETSPDVQQRRILLLGLANSLGFTLYLGYAFLFGLK